MSSAPDQRSHAEVTVLSPLLAPEHYSFSREIVSIGRASDCNIPIKDRYLSRRHAELIPEAGAWRLRDCGSANGTYLNGARVEGEVPLQSGDRIRVGDTEILFHSEPQTDRLLSIAEAKVSATISIPVQEIEDTPEVTRKTYDRVKILNALAIEMIEDRPLDTLFSYVLERIMDHLKPSRVAIGLLSDSGQSLAHVEVSRSDKSDQSELMISRTLLAEVVEQKRALAFIDVGADEKLSRAKSIIMQGIHSVLCAPLMINDAVVGVLYVDFLFTQRAISEEDVRLVAQIARFAGVKLENTRLREESIKKHLMDEELKTAYLIQRRLLPEQPPKVEGFTFAGLNRPCRTVSGDYFDFVERPDGRVYFVIADVSGKGVTAALLMAGLQASFRIFAKSDPTPGELVAQLNQALKESLPQSKFITMFAGRLDPASGVIEFTNAGHNPPLWTARGKSEEITDNDLLLGMFPKAEYHTHTLHLDLGDSLALFTDGLSEAENASGEEFGIDRMKQTLVPLHGRPASDIASTLEHTILEFAAEHNLTDDLTLLVVARG